MASNKTNSADAKHTGSKDNSMSTAQAGRMGGEKVLNERGPKFYSEIGQQQGKENNPGNFANRPHEDVVDAARKGGETRGEQLHEAAESEHESGDSNRGSKQE